MIHGVVNIYKEKGFTSHDVVAKLRGIVKQKKIGHTGTLDPDAEGVLPVCFGKATKLCDMLTDKDKTYETVLLLGKSTDTQDISGTVLSESNTEHLTEEDVRAAILSFVGDYSQIPPMYSALKVDGKKLYELAREGKEIERKARPVTIFHINIREVNLPRIRMEVKCSKGTYIRTLCHDIGNKLGCGGCMEELLRTQVERFELCDSIRLSEVSELWNAGELMSKVVAIDEMFSNYKKIVLTPDGERAVCNGNNFHIREVASGANGVFFENNEKVRVYGNNENFIAIYEYHKELHGFKIVKMFFDGRDN